MLDAMESTNRALSLERKQIKRKMPVPGSEFPIM